MKKFIARWLAAVLLTFVSFVVTEFIFLAEPQLWVNLKNIKAMEKIKLSVGTEMEVSCNFVEKGFRLMPTLATKWTF